MPSDVGQSIKGLVARALPTSQTDNQRSEARFGRDGSQYVSSLISTKHLLADEGAYFIVTNPTIGTGVAHALTTSFSATQGLFVIKNNDAAGGKRIYLDYLKLMLTSAGATAGVSNEFSFEIDSGNRVPTAGQVLQTPVNTNGDASNSSIALPYAFSGAQLTVPAAVSSRTTGRVKQPLASAAPGNVTGDVYIVQFGASDLSGMISPTATTRTGAITILSNAPPQVIGPGQHLVIHRWNLTEATTAPSYEYELTWWER